MRETSAKEILTFWLIPTEPARSYFLNLIADLAARFDAPIFEPHVTLYATDAVGEDAHKLLDGAVAGAKACRLTIAGIGHSQEFTKTLFVQFDSHQEVTSFTARFAASSKSHQDYEINPHLSLIYKDLPAEEK